MDSERVEYTVSSTTIGGRSVLAPITFIMRSGAMVTQDYLTPENARELAAELLRTAEEEDDKYADQRAHDVTWMTAQERDALDKQDGDDLNGR